MGSESKVLLVWSALEYIIWVDITISTKNEEDLRAKRLEGSSKMGGEASATSFYLAVLTFSKVWQLNKGLF